MIPIDKDGIYWIDADSDSFILKKKRTTDPTHKWSKGAVKTHFDTIGYYSSINSLFEGFSRHSTRDIFELTDDIQEIKDLLKEIRDAIHRVGVEYQKEGEPSHV